MGIGTTDTPPRTAAEWNGGSCDVMAVALRRMYDLPMMAEFEWGYEDGKEVLGCLVHAWVRLPDGRMLDAAGPSEMWIESDGKDPNDDWVEGYRVVELTDRDPHLLWIREENGYGRSIRSMRAPEWAFENLGPTLSALGLEPIRYRSLLGLPPAEPDLADGPPEAPAPSM